MLLFYITHPDAETAERIGKALLAEKLIACYNIFPIQSGYIWEGAPCAEGEWVTLLKTNIEHIDAIETLVTQMHPYTTPCIIRWEVQSNTAYEAWVQQAVSRPV